MSPRFTRRIGMAVAVVVLVALLVIAARQIDAGRALVELRTVRAPWLVAAFGCYLAILPLWALEWRTLSPPAERNTFVRQLRVVSVTSSTLNTTAFLVGEAAGVVLLVTQIGLTRSAALSVMTMDQLLVGVAKLAVLAVGALMLTLPGWMSAGVIALAGGVFALLLGCLLAAWNPESIGRRAAGVLPASIASALGSMARALAPMRSPSRAGFALLLALAKKAVEVLAIVCVQRAFGVSLPLASGVLVLAALNLATLLPLVPGNLGIYEGAVALTYNYLGLGAEQAVGMAVVQHVCYFAALALPGYLFLAASGASRMATAAP